jgi:ArsR family transcriptional regulator, arsenate/arsenite/antimonite-responsive transcriptional repressor
MISAPEVFHCLADATRWEILRRLADGPCCVCELTDCLAVPQSTLSTHLQVLRASGLLVGERRGRWMYYGIARESRPLLRMLWKHFPLTTEPLPEANCVCPA